MRVDQRQPSPTTSLPTSILDDAPGLVATRSPDGVGPARQNSWWSPLWMFLVADVAAVAATSILLGFDAASTLTAALSVVAALRFANLYRKELVPSVFDQAGRVIRSVAAGALIAAALTGRSAQAAAVFAAGATALILVGRVAACRQVRTAAARRPSRTVVVGTGQAGQELLAHLLDHPELGLMPLGFIDSDPAPLDPNLPVTVLGPLAWLRDLVQQLDVDRLLLDASSVREGDLVEMLDLAAGLDIDIDISVLPALARHLSSSVVVESIGDATVLSYRRSRHHGISWATKRGIDLIGAVLTLLVTAPIWLVVAIAVKLDSAGPVFYRQQRVGRHGREFTIYKFRSMETDADAKKTLYLDLNEADGPYFKLRSDPRVTRVGRIIRRYSIDELPQLLNVLTGDMSLVGPRPALATEVNEYPDWVRRRLVVRPGLTGLWQVSGRFLLPFAQAAKLDVNYVDHWSLALDLKILARTPTVVLSGHGAH